MGNPLRVLHVAVNMNRGGAETLLMNLYRNIDRTKVQFDFLTCKPGVFDEEIKKMGGIVHRIPYISDVGHFGYIKQLDEFFKNNEYKVVHSHLDKISGIVLQSARKAGVPIRISHSHNTQSEGGVATKVYKWYAGKQILPNATNLFACSSKAAKWLFLGKSNNARLLKNGIEVNQFAFSSEKRMKVRKDFNIPDDVFVLGHVGRFCHQKNHSFLIDIFHKFNKVNEKSLLVLVGDGPLRRDMEKKCTKLGIKNRVLFLGERGDINHLLQAFDTFVFPSLHEGLPVSLIEAQGAGLPCVISDQISNEVDLGLNLVDYASINRIEEWLEKIKINMTRKKERQLSDWLFSEKGYDIKVTAKELEKYYIQVEGEAV